MVFLDIKPKFANSLANFWSKTKIISITKTVNLFLCSYASSAPQSNIHIMTNWQSIIYSRLRKDEDLRFTHLPVPVLSFYRLFTVSAMFPKGEELVPQANIIQKENKRGGVR
uniref:Ovule protein n=1 Tax=Caenorhabditis tropicalis TaxID=1561998 RepID=A0A1I7TC71_9PELO